MAEDLRIGARAEIRPLPYVAVTPVARCSCCRALHRRGHYLTALSQRDDYTRIVRLESVLLGFMDDRSDLRRTKQSLLRSNTRNVFKADEDDRLVHEHQSIQRIAQTIEERCIALGKTSGFERNYHRATLLYFGGMKRHFANLRAALRPGARLAYVVGDQASYLRVMIRTGQLLAEIAESRLRGRGYRPIPHPDGNRHPGAVARRSAAAPLAGVAQNVDHVRRGRYERIIEKVFFDHYALGDEQVTFGRRADCAADALGIDRVNNPPDMIYSFRYRTALPALVLQTAQPGHTGDPRGKGARCSLTREMRLAPNPHLVATTIPDATPGVADLRARGRAGAAGEVALQPAPRCVYRPHVLLPTKSPAHNCRR